MRHFPKKQAVCPGCGTIGPIRSAGLCEFCYRRRYDLQWKKRRAKPKEAK